MSLSGCFESAGWVTRNKHKTKYTHHSQYVTLIPSSEWAVCPAGTFIINHFFINHFGSRFFALVHGIDLLIINQIIVTTSRGAVTSSIQ